MYYQLEHLLYCTLYGDTDHAVRMHDIVGELCYRGSLCLVFLHGFDYSVGCSNRLIREYIPDSGILIEYTYMYDKINTDLGSCKWSYEEKRQKICVAFFFTYVTSGCNVIPHDSFRICNPKCRRHSETNTIRWNEININTCSISK